MNYRYGISIGKGQKELRMGRDGITNIQDRNNGQSKLVRFDKEAEKNR